MSAELDSVRERADAAAGVEERRREAFDDIAGRIGRQAARLAARRMKRISAPIDDSYLEWSARYGQGAESYLAAVIAEAIAEAFERPDPEAASERVFGAYDDARSLRHAD